MAFPIDDLKPIGGRCYAHLFENPRTGLARNLFWSFTIDFAPVSLSGDLFDPSATIEWVVLPIRNWRDLVGVDIHGAYGANGVESTFYVFEHSYADIFSLRVSRWRQRSADLKDPRMLVDLEVEMELLVDYPGYDDDPEPKLPVSGKTWVEFEGIMVNESAISPKAATIEQAREALQCFIDVAHLVEPHPGRSTWRPSVHP